MMGSNTGKRRSWQIALGALALGIGLAGVGAAPALAHDGDEGWHRGWGHDRDWDRDRHEWREHEWREHEWREHHPGWYGYSYYAPPPPVVYQPPAYAYYPPSSSLNVYIPLR